MIKNHKHIVFCEEHYNPLGLVRSLGEYGIRSYVISTSSKPQMIRKSKYIQEYIFAECIHDAYKILMDRFGNEDLRPFLYTSDDIRTSFLDERYEELKDKFYFFNAGSNGRITYFMDKDNINKLAMKHGLNVLKSIKVERGVIPEGLEYPIITKSISSTVGGWKNDVFICHNENELKKAYERIKAHTVLIQKYIEKKNELCLDGFSANNGKDVLFAIASNYNYILPDTYSSYMKIFNFTDKELGDKLRCMFSEVGFEGIFSVEFLVDDSDNLYFCEINFRNSTWSYASTCAGMNLPVLWAQCMCEEIKFDEKKFVKTIPQDFNAMVEIGDFKARVVTRKIGIFKWINDFRKSKCKFYCAKGDYKPVITKIIGK